MNNEESDLHAAFDKSWDALQTTVRRIRDWRQSARQGGEAPHETSELLHVAIGIAAMNAARNNLDNAADFYERTAKGMSDDESEDHIRCVAELTAAVGTSKIAQVAIEVSAASLQSAIAYLTEKVPEYSMDDADIASPQA